MKLVVYTLNNDGTIPNYVIDGGYLAWDNGGISPQDLDLVGVATDDGPQDSFANEAELLSYATSKGFEFMNLTTLEIIPLQIVVASIWNKIEA